MTAPTGTDVALEQARAEDAPVLSRLMQLYVHDLSDLVEMDIGDDGRFPFAPEERYWTEARYQPFFLRVGARLAGFVVVDGVSRLTGESVNDMSQFFVLRRYRRRGVGAAAAVATFDLFSGAWEVRQAAANAAAIAFWRRVIDGYTGGRFTDDAWDDSRFRGQVQRFVAPPRR
jgi:predicted acetyltransferase